MRIPLSRSLLLTLLASCFFGFTSIYIVHGQNDDNAAYALFDQVIGKTNSGIFNGTEYFDKFQSKSDKHKFFKHKFFIWGSVIYKDQPYFETALKYDVHADELLIKNSDILDAPITLLDKKYVSQFELNGHTFKNISFLLKQDKRVTGFFEVLVENQTISVYKKHQKKISRNIEKDLYYEFKDQFKYYILYNDNYYELKKVSFLSSIFPEYKAQLKNSFKKYEHLRKTNVDDYLLSIIDDLNKHVLK